MRSHPYTPPPPLPPALNDLADELSSILPNQDARARRRCSLPDIPLSNLDPETSLLLSPAARQRHHHHHVRVQGRLALVRSVSAVRTRSSITGNTSPAGSTPPVPPVPRYESAVGGSVMSGRKRGSRGRRRRKGSLADEFGDGGTESESDDDGERQRETVIRDTQLRGYGIGGAGNIRRPIDVVHFSPSNRMDSLLLLSSVAPSSPTSLTSPQRRKWNLREIFGLDRRPKGKATF
ncbi:hypothetical protein NKR19_g4159 [Coniochaeta hoffmannii]|uniref:Uncharacterized protein n=1 Tax=Coniochaeta hoffmannii TaxID=91930 RepID=A0AA38VXF1_9PEZI|nr:hypothetical protein NKR19_g4159 [Coniochaeta hoffmannii]